MNSNYYYYNNDVTVDDYLETDLLSIGYYPKYLENY